MDNESFWNWLNCTERSSGSNYQFYAENFGKFCTYNVCNYIFSFCNKLKTPHLVPFISFILYDRFLCFELQSLIKSYNNVNPAQIRLILGRKKKDITLHLYSVIQITTKCVDRRKILKASALEKIFKRLSLDTDVEHIVNSEVCVLDSLQSDLNCFDFLTPVEFLISLKNHSPDEVNLEVVLDFLYVVSANLSRLSDDVRLIFRKKVQPHVCFRILTAATVVCVVLDSSKFFLVYTRFCSSLLSCSTDELLSVVHCILSLF